MSQFVRVNISMLKNVSPSIFKFAVENMKTNGKDVFSLDTESKHVHAPYALGERKSDDVDCVLVKNGQPLTIGFKFGVGKNKELQIRGDFWNTGLEESEFRDMIAQNYTAAKIHHDAISESQYLVKRAVKADGSIVLRYSM